MPGNKILVTGATGFLGSHLCDVFQAHGFEVVGVARDRSRLGCAVALEPRIEFVDLVGLRDMLTAGRFNTVVHAATEYGRGGDVSNTELIDANVTFPISVLTAARRNNENCRFLNTDSFFTKVGNSSGYLPAYAQSKRQLVQQLKSVDRGVVNLRIEHVYGPRDRPPKFVPWLLEELAANRAVPLTAGDQFRDFVHVSDVAGAFLSVLREPIGDRFLEYEVGTGEPVHVRRFVEEAHRVVGSSSNLNFGAIPSRPGEIQHSVADISALAGLGWHPTISYADGLLSCVAPRHVRRV